MQFTSDGLNEVLAQVVQIANSSAIATYDWHDRGIAPCGYIKGMAIVFAQVYCKLLSNDVYAVAMAKANTGNRAKDVLAYYRNKFSQLGMHNGESGAAILRHLFVLLLGLGMRESSGRWCEGRDMAANNTMANTAEAGLFQTSWNAHLAHPLLPQLFECYRAYPVCFLDVFKEGVTVDPQELYNFGSGNGEEFQRLSKECPVFAAKFAAIGLRNTRTHWGPVNRYEAEIRPEANHMFLQVQQAVHSLNLCKTIL